MTPSTSSTFSSRVQHPAFGVLFACLASAGLLAACGGGGGTSSALSATGGVAPAPAVPTTTVSGSVVKGPVNGANVCAYKVTAAGKGDQIRCVASSAGGSYSMDIQYIGDVVIEATGGSYTDEATNTSRTLANPLQVVISSQGGNTTGVVTPLTSVAYSISRGLAGGVSSSNFASAANTVASQFRLAAGSNIASTVPTLGSGANTYGQALQAFSRFVANGGSFSNFVTWTNPTSFQAAYGTAYAAANGVTVSFNFDAASGTGTAVVGGTGAGGGSATCAVSVAGTIATSGVTVPVNYKYCIRGLNAADSCSASNGSINQAVQGQSGLAGVANLNYTYNSDCSGSLITIDLR